MKMNLQFENIQEIPKDMMELIIGSKLDPYIHYSGNELYRDLKKKLIANNIRYVESFEERMDLDILSLLLQIEKDNIPYYRFNNGFGDSILFKKSDILKMNK